MSIRGLNPTAYFQAQFRLVNQVKMFERRTYSLLDMIGDVGGFTEALYVFSMLSVSIAASKMFNAAQIRDLFHVRMDTGRADMKRLLTKLPSSERNRLNKNDEA